MSEFNQKEYDIKYQKNNLIRIPFNLNKNYDADIIEKLNSIDNRQGYIKALIREDMKKNAK